MDFIFNQQVFKLDSSKRWVVMDFEWVYFILNTSFIKVREVVGIVVKDTTC